MRLKLHDTLFALSWATLIGLPVALVWSVANGAAAPEAVRAAFPGVSIASTPGPATAWAVFLVGLAPWLAVMAALWNVQALFALFRRGAALSHDAANRIRDIGLCLMAVAALGVIAHAGQLLLLTGGNAPGERVLAIQFGSAEIGFLLAGGLMIVIGRAMAEAARAVAENRSFV